VLRVLADVLVPVYLVVGVGLVVGRAARLDHRPLATLAYWVLGPAFIFDVLASAELDPAVVGRVVAASLAVVVAIGVAATALSRLFGLPYGLGAASVLTSVHGNVGNFGLAVCAFAFGEEALPIAGIVLVTVNTVGIITGVGLAAFREGSVLSAMARAVASPLALAVIPALVVNVAGIELPLWLDRPVSLLAGALIPVMLLTLGIQLSSMHRSRTSALVTIPIGLKLVVAPALAFAAAALLSLGGLEADVVIVQAAMPAAVFTSLIALEHDLEPDFVTSVVLIGTLASVLTLPLVLSLV